jgi:hypothetical protein
MEAGEGAECLAGAAAAAESASLNPEEAGKRDDGNGNYTDDDRRRAPPGKAMRRISWIDQRIRNDVWCAGVVFF